MGDDSLPPSLLAPGVTDMVRVTDARMSGTSFGTVFLHVAPEAAVGGPIGLVRDGDIDRASTPTPARSTLEVSDEELAARAPRRPAVRTSGRGYVSLYSGPRAAGPEGCDFDFLAGTPGEAPRLDRAGGGEVLIGRESSMKGAVVRVARRAE